MSLPHDYIELGVHLDIDPKNKIIALREDIDDKLLWSFLLEEWKNNDELIKYQIPIVDCINSMEGAGFKIVWKTDWTILHLHTAGLRYYK